MSRGTEFEFVSADAGEITDALTQAYELMFGTEVKPGSPEKLFIQWAANVMVQAYVRINYAANQNLPSRAEGANLDELGETIFGLTRPGATSATTTVRFTISQAQESGVLIPQGTRVCPEIGTPVFEAEREAIIAPGDTYADIPCFCQTAGAAGNGYLAGEINTLIDVFPYATSAVNITESDGGADRATDEEYYEMMRASTEAYTTAGAKGAYEYIAKRVSATIRDVLAARPARDAQETLTVYDGSVGKRCFLGGNTLIETLKLYLPTGQAAQEGSDYEITESGGYFEITLTESGALYGETQIDAEYREESLGEVNIYALSDDGEPAGEELKARILQALNAENARPLTDLVRVEDPETVPYDIDLTYYISTESGGSAAEIAEKVNKAVSEYKAWQSGKLGRDINPARLIQTLMQTGVKRVYVNAPVFSRLKNGADGSAPQIAQIGETVIRNGGYEDE